MIEKWKKWIKILAKFQVQAQIMGEKDPSSARFTIYAGHYLTESIAVRASATEKDYLYGDYKNNIIRPEQVDDMIKGLNKLKQIFKKTGLK